MQVVSLLLLALAWTAAAAPQKLFDSASGCNCDPPTYKTPNPSRDLTCDYFSPTDGCRSAKDWKTRTIYQLLTDRFASPTNEGCGDSAKTGSKYCGGTWNATTAKLPYIKSLGFDAIWISPINVNAAGRYHGYHPDNLWEVNPKFGTAQDLRTLVNEAHKLDMWVMIDIVMNHMSDNEIPTFYPFNKPEHFHDCIGCKGCDIDFAGSSCGYQSTWSVEHCQLAGLKDLNQDNAFVTNTLVKWLKCVVPAFGFDGIRVDTVPEVKPWVWGKLVDAMGPNCYFVGEASNTCFDYVVSFINKGPGTPGLPALLEYPLYYELLRAFGTQMGENKFYSYNLGWLADTFNYHNSKADMSIWGLFLDNHDTPRFLSQFEGDANNYKYRIPLLHNALTWLMLQNGIPILYYGTEQQYNGGGEPRSREPLWYSGYNKANPTYKLITALNKARKAAQVWKYPVKEWWRPPPSSGDDFYAFTHGPVLVIVSNRPWLSFTKKFKVGDAAGGIPGNTEICNILVDCNDCVKTDANSVINVKLAAGEPKVYLPNCRNALYGS